MNGDYNQDYGYGKPQDNHQWQNEQSYNHYQQPTPVNNNQNYNYNYGQGAQGYDAYNYNQQQQQQSQSQGYNSYSVYNQAQHVPEAGANFINQGNGYGLSETSPYQYPPYPMQQQQSFPQHPEPIPQPIPPPGYQLSPFQSSPQIPQPAQYQAYTPPVQPVQGSSQYYPQQRQSIPSQASPPLQYQQPFPQPIPQQMAPPNVQHQEQALQFDYYQTPQNRIPQAHPSPPIQFTKPIPPPAAPQQSYKAPSITKPPPYQQPTPQRQQQQHDNTIKFQTSPQSVKKRKVEELRTPSKPIINSSKQGTPVPSLSSEPNFNVNTSEIRIEEPVNEVRRLDDEEIEPPKLEIKNSTQFKDFLNQPMSNVAVILNIANELNTHADLNSKRIKTKTNLQEYYTLKQLAISIYLKILNHKPKISKEYRLECHSTLGDIYQGLIGMDTEEQQDSLDTAGYHYDQVLLLCGENNTHGKLITQTKIVNLLIEKAQYKQALRLLDDLFEYLSINDSIYLVHLKFQLLIKSDPSQALPYLQHSLNRLSQSQTSDVYDDGLLLLRLNECCYAIQQGVEPVTDISELKSDNNLKSLHISFIQILLRITNKKLNDVKETETLFKQASTALSELKSAYSEAQYHLPFAGKIITVSDHLPTYKLNILICLMYGISLLNSSYHKRKSLNLFEKSLKLINEQLSRNNNSLLSVKSGQKSVNDLNHLKALVIFFKVIENSLIGPISKSLLQDFKASISTLSHEHHEGFEIKVLYTIALKFQLEGDLANSSKTYKHLINQPTTSKRENSEVYIFSVLNYLLLIESDIHYYTRVSQNDLIPDLAQKRKSILSILDEIVAAKDSTIKDKHLVHMTISFIKMVYNYENSSKIEINEQVSKILQDFEKIRDFPLLCSILLYIKSNTLNSNSDQKQKSSQTSFNLAKLGFSPIIRYISGILNKNNATIARNFQQAEIQNEKLKKIRNNLGNTIVINRFNDGDNVTLDFGDLEGIIESFVK